MSLIAPPPVTPVFFRDPSSRFTFFDGRALIYETSGSDPEEVSLPYMGIGIVLYGMKQGSDFLGTYLSQKDLVTSSIMEELTGITDNIQIRQYLDPDVYIPLPSRWSYPMSGSEGDYPYRVVIYMSDTSPYLPWVGIPVPKSGDPVMRITKNLLSSSMDVEVNIGGQSGVQWSRQSIGNLRCWAPHTRSAYWDTRVRKDRAVTSSRFFSLYARVVDWSKEWEQTGFVLQDVRRERIFRADARDSAYLAPYWNTLPRVVQTGEVTPLTLEDLLKDIGTYEYSFGGVIIPRGVSLPGNNGSLSPSLRLLYNCVFDTQSILSLDNVVSGDAQRQLFDVSFSVTPVSTYTLESAG